MNNVNKGNYWLSALILLYSASNGPKWGKVWRDESVDKIVSDILSRNTCVALKRAVLWSVLLVGNCLTSESVQGSALSLQGVDDVHGCDGLPLGVLCVCNGITDYIFQEDFEYTSGLFVDESGDESGLKCNQWKPRTQVRQLIRMRLTEDRSVWLQCANVLRLSINSVLEQPLSLYWVLNAVYFTHW